MDYLLSKSGRSFMGKLDGPNKILEIDKSCLFKRQYNQGRPLSQVLRVGIVEHPVIVLLLRSLKLEQLNH